MAQAEAAAVGSNPFQPGGGPAGCFGCGPVPPGGGPAGSFGPGPVQPGGGPAGCFGCLTPLEPLDTGADGTGLRLHAGRFEGVCGCLRKWQRLHAGRLESVRLRHAALKASAGVFGSGRTRGSKRSTTTLNPYLDPKEPLPF